MNEKALETNFHESIKDMEEAILTDLSSLKKGYGSRKWAISERVGIPVDILTVLLKRLKSNGKVELIMIWSDDGLPNGSGYCLKGSQ